MEPCPDAYTRVYYFGCLKGVSKSAKLLFNGLEAVMVLTFRYRMPSTIHHIPSTIYYILHSTY